MELFGINVTRGPGKFVAALRSGDKFDDFYRQTFSLPLSGPDLRMTHWDVAT